MKYTYIMIWLCIPLWEQSISSTQANQSPQSLKNHNTIKMKNFDIYGLANHDIIGIKIPVV